MIPISLRSIVIFSSHLRLGLSKGLLLAGVPVKKLETILPSSILATWHEGIKLLHLLFGLPGDLLLAKTDVANHLLSEVFTIFSGHLG